MGTTAPRWTREEDDTLQFLAGDLPTPMVIQQYRSWAARNNHYPRTACGVYRRMERLGLLFLVRAGSFTTTGAAAEILGCSNGCICTWLLNARIAAILRPVWRSGIRYIHRDSWRRLARTMPEVLGGFSADQLFILLEDRTLANAVATQFRCRRSDNRIRCVETGRVWPSAPAAANDLHVAPSTITQAIRRNRPVAALGLRFERLRGAA